MSERERCPVAEIDPKSPVHAMVRTLLDYCEYKDRRIAQLERDLVAMAVERRALEARLVDLTMGDGACRCQGHTHVVGAWRGPVLTAADEERIETERLGAGQSNGRSAAVGVEG